MSGVAGLPSWMADLFRSAPPTRCARCGGTRHLIADDGTTVCRACVMRYADIVRRPERLTQGEARLLTEAHGDVAALGLDACVHGLGSSGVLAWWHYVLTWRWVASGWPDVGESEGLDQVIARRLAELGREDR